MMDLQKFSQLLPVQQVESGRWCIDKNDSVAASFAHSSAGFRFPYNWLDSVFCSCMERHAYSAPHHPPPTVSARLKMGYTYLRNEKAGKTTNEIHLMKGRTTCPGLP